MSMMINDLATVRMVWPLNSQVDPRCFVTLPDRSIDDDDDDDDNDPATVRNVRPPNSQGDPR